MSITSPDDRLSSYSPVVATTEFAAQFPVFDNSDIAVYHNGSPRDDFTVSATYVDGVSIDAIVVFSPGIVGRIDVVGARASRRANQFTNGAPLLIRDQNIAFNTVQSEVQEVSRETRRALKAKFGDPAQDLPSPQESSYLGWRDGVLVNRPDTETSIAAAEAAALAAQAAAVSINLKRVPDKAGLAALNPDVTKLAFEPDDTGWDLKEQDFSAAAGFDVNQHMVYPATGKLITQAAWYRRQKGDRPSLRDAFKAKGDNVADDMAALQDAIYWMEFYPLRSRVLTVDPGLFRADYLEIPNEITGIQLVGNHWNSNIVCGDPGTAPTLAEPVPVSIPAILNKSQEFKMDGVALISSVANSTNWTNRKNGLVNMKDPGLSTTADIDCIINECRIAGFYRGIYNKGRSIVVRGGHFASCDYAIELDWPDYFGVGDPLNEYLPGTNQLTDDLGNRGVIIEDVRIHSPNGGAVLNARKNAHKLRNLRMSNITLDIGRRLFYGHLGRGSKIHDCVSDMSPLEVLALTGGEDFIISDIIGKGSGKAGVYTPQNLVHFLPGAAAESGYPDADGRVSDPYNSGTGLGTTGRFRNGLITDCEFAYSEQHAIRDTSSQMDDVTFANIKFRDVGFSAPASYRCFSFGSQNSDIRVINSEFMGTDTLNGVVGNNFGNNRIKVSGPEKSIGNNTPWIAGSPIILIGKRQTYQPVIVTGAGTVPDPYVVTGTNIATSPLPTVSVLDWAYEDDDWIVLGGRFTAAVISAASDGEIDLALPVPSTFTQPYQAYGSFICSTAGQNIAGSVTASGSRLKLRWKAPNTSNYSFSFSARYRKL